MNLSADPRVAARVLNECRCDGEKIRAVHLYLKTHFVGATLDHFHTPTTVIQEGAVTVRAHYHVVRIAAGEIVAHTIVLDEFLEHSATEIQRCLQQSNLAGTLRAHPFVILAKDAISVL